MARTRGWGQLGSPDGSKSGGRLTPPARDRLRALRYIFAPRHRRQQLSWRTKKRGGSTEQLKSASDNCASATSPCWQYGHSAICEPAFAPIDNLVANVITTERCFSMAIDLGYRVEIPIYGKAKPLGWCALGATVLANKQKWSQVTNCRWLTHPILVPKGHNGDSIRRLVWRLTGMDPRWRWRRQRCVLVARPADRVCVRSDPRGN